MADYSCKACDFKATGPTGLSKHYKAKPSHKLKSQRAIKAASMRKRRARMKGLSSPFTPKTGVRHARLRFCTSCGTRRSPGWSYCGRCGGRL